MKDFVKGVPVWVLILGSVLVAGAIAIGVWHLAGGGMAGMH